jgi:hypothetical protein
VEDVWSVVFVFVFVFGATVATFVIILFSLVVTAIIFVCDLFVIVKTSMEERIKDIITKEDDTAIRFLIVYYFSAY